VDHGHYIEAKPQSLMNDIIVDLWAVVTLNRVLLPKLRERKCRSAILNISSCTGVYLSGHLGVYSSCKKSLDVYSRILSQ
jgi:short-subunit dehydrogenase involved in D-alanine esterification of teichoic acids